MKIYKHPKRETMKLSFLSGKSKMEQLCVQSGGVIDEPLTLGRPTGIMDRDGHWFCHLGCAFLFYQVHVVPTHCMICGELFQPAYDGTFSYVDSRMNYFCSNECVSRYYGFGITK